MIGNSHYLQAVMAAIRPHYDYKPIHIVSNLLKRVGIELGRKISSEEWQAGTYFPSSGLTMIGEKRLLALCQSVLELAGNGDFVEVGVWRGGTLIWLSALAKVYSPESRVIGFDTFNGFSENDPRDPTDRLKWCNALRVPVTEVRANLDCFGLKAELVVGPAQDTMPKYSFERIAILRLDCDQYAPTRAALEAAWPHLIHGGHVHVDDWTLPGAKAAVMEFLEDTVDHHVKITSIDALSAQFVKP